MRLTPLVLSALVALAGCASSEASRKSAAAPLPWCNPCPYPCASPCGGKGAVAPAAFRPRVAVTSEKLELSETVYFDTDKTTIDPASHSILDEVAKVLNGHPEMRHVRVEGHTDNTGNDDVNTTLSQGRAEAVRDYLVKKGVAADRLEAKGYGPSRPAADNATPEGREKNRRVEFLIER